MRQPDQYLDTLVAIFVIFNPRFLLCEIKYSIILADASKINPIFFNTSQPLYMSIF